MPLKINYITKTDTLLNGIYFTYCKIAPVKVTKIIKKGLYPLCFILGWLGAGTASNVIASIYHCVGH